MKLRFSRGLELDAIAESHGVHRATVTRRLAGLCSRLGRALHTELARQGTNLSTSEMQALAQLLRSQLTGAVDSWMQRSLRGLEAAQGGAEAGRAS